MSQAAIRPNIDVVLNATRKITSEIPFYTIGLVDDSPEIDDFFVGQDIRLLAWIDSSVREDFESGSTTYAIDVSQPNLDSFVPRQLNAGNARHAFFSYRSKMKNRLALSLFMAGILANDTDDAGSFNDLAFSADLFH